ncbi:unnamed protein product [Heligmosomoides polygyrus]|uniref:PPM-type phosphatase domain-containing protein n=1 Tax=Heligmosomoides polygyrus TaxID=6339 RepID=A0A183FAH3_HELPZ|nr:unnamed protein product [Heligmosomoides polygyrus]
MAHVALPSLAHPMARSKKVQDMFELADIASSSEQACWGDERREEELRKNSPYITACGLALAIDAHRRRRETVPPTVAILTTNRVEDSIIMRTASHIVPVNRT